MSIAIFDIEQEAIDFSNEIHAWLTKNRKYYYAPDGWMVPNKSDKIEEWAVKIPPDYPKLNLKIAKVEEKFSIPVTVKRTIEKYPVDWKTIEETIGGIAVATKKI